MKPLLTAVAALLLIGCGVTEELISIRSELNEQSEHLANIDTSLSGSEVDAPDDLTQYQPISRAAFYSEGLGNDRILDQQGDWIKLEVSRKDSLDPLVNRMVRVAWYHAANPNTYYLVLENWELHDIQHIPVMPADTIVGSGSTGSIGIFGTIGISPLPGWGLQPIVRQDLLSQKEFDLLLAARHMFWDGMVIKSKLMEYVDLSGGSYRGTTFEGTHIANSNIVGADPRSKAVDFYRTKMKNQTVFGNFFKNCRFEKMHMKYSNWSQTELHDSYMIECGFEAGTNWERVTVKHTNAGYWRYNRFFATQFNQCYFDSAQVLSNASYGAQFNGCRFFNSTIKGLSAYRNLENGVPTRFNGCSFNKVQFISGFFNNTEFVAPFGSSMINVEFIYGQYIKAKFEGNFENCDFVLGNYTETDFSGSRFFGNVTFGTSINHPVGTKMRSAKFVNCAVNGTVEFINCDLTGADFTGTDLSNITFTNCIGAPQ